MMAIIEAGNAVEHMPISDELRMQRPCQYSLGLLQERR
ncbi:hypothetical protein SLEP1_g3001 [Rubroshorea leprosula]|uniref:Uncharacterized protein n=1 Tax=Rubroshorea leprosula TaxID=152421 RepID=A0AAV5HUU1_9ROSI|nr:hypothetical protein SLEP1_g3001 [Rubroshorea leprosula]